MAEIDKVAIVFYSEGEQVALSEYDVKPGEVLEIGVPELPDNR